MQDEEIKSIIIEAGFSGDNIEDIIASYSQELMFDRFNGFEGLFFYEFLQVL